jgi:enoyl-CoA hydratase/carnithine racemase
MTLVIREDRGAIARLTLNRPDKLNALSEAMLGALQTALDDVADDPSIRVVILAATGRAFCAGHDLAEMTAARAEEDGGAGRFAELFNACAEVMQTIVALHQPVIAEVQGLATAAGCQLVATCDLAIAADTARFGVNGVNIGLFCSTPMVALSRNISRKKAFELLTTGAFVSADRAVGLGLVNRAVPNAELRRETYEIADAIAGKLGSAVKIGKRAFYDQLEMPLAQAYAFTGQVMVENMLNPDTAEGIGAFLEKRQPDWPQ